MALDNFRQVCLPYCLDRQPDGSYVVLNREYKPLGFTEKRLVKYEEYPIQIRLQGLTRELATRISHNGNPDLQRIYLYDDDCAPNVGYPKDMQAYLKRLEMLMPLKLEKTEG